MNKKEVLEKIIEKKGNCLSYKTCRHCPFARKCLPKFISDKKNPLSNADRLNLALDSLIREEFFKDSETHLDYEDESANT